MILTKGKEIDLSDFTPEKIEIEGISIFSGVYSHSGRIYLTYGAGTGITGVYAIDGNGNVEKIPNPHPENPDIEGVTIGTYPRQTMINGSGDWEWVESAGMGGDDVYAFAAKNGIEVGYSIFHVSSGQSLNGPIGITGDEMFFMYLYETSESGKYDAFVYYVKDGVYSIYEMDDVGDSSTPYTFVKAGNLFISGENNIVDIYNKFTVTDEIKFDNWTDDNDVSPLIGSADGFSSYAYTLDEDLNISFRNVYSDLKTKKYHIVNLESDSRILFQISDNFCVTCEIDGSDASFYSFGQIEKEIPDSVRYIDLRYSKDGGHNWSNWRKLPMGEVGDFVKRIQSRRFGRGRQWVFDIRVTDPVRADIMAASIMVEPTES